MLHNYTMAIPGDFALNFNVPLWHANNPQYDNRRLLDLIVERRIKNQSYLQDYQKTKDSPWFKENIFSWPDPCMRELANLIRANVQSMRAEMGLPPAGALWINGWATVLHTGADLTAHCHATHTNSYLSGVWIAGECANSSTDFLLPQFEHLEDVGVVQVPNCQGDMILFPQWLFHRVSPVQQKVRITVGFDIDTQAAVDYYNQNCSDQDLPIKRSIPF